MKSNWLPTIVIAIITAGAAFFGGMQYQKSQVTANSNGDQYAQTDQRQGSRFGGGRGRFGGAIIGNAVNQDANSITVKLQDGSSKIINISDNTTFYKTDTAAKTDIQTDMRIAAFGTTNSDGSITAQSIQINPPIRMRGGR